MTAMLTGVTAWRPPGIKYDQNEIYIDVVEQVNLLVSATGDLVLLESVLIFKKELFYVLMYLAKSY